VHIFRLKTDKNDDWPSVGDMTLASSTLYIATGRKSLLSIPVNAITQALGGISPSLLTVSVHSVVETCSSVAFEIFNDKPMLWIGDIRDKTHYAGGYANAYHLNVDGSYQSGAQRVGRAYVGSNVVGMAILKQFTKRYMAVSRCTYAPGYSCVVHFLEMKGSTYVSFVLSDSEYGDIRCAMRVPIGIQGIDWTDSDVKMNGFMLSVFSSESNAMHTLAARLSVTGEDRYMKWNVPVLKTEAPTVHSNYIYWSFLGNSISTMTPAVPLRYVGPEFRRSALTAGGTFLEGTIVFFTLSYTFPVLGIPVGVSLSSQGTFFVYVFYILHFLKYIFSRLCPSRF
jgi:hypothetical protein